MESTKKIIVSKISKQRKIYQPKKKEVLVHVKDGEIVDVIRGAVEYPITHEDGSEWYCVDCNEQQYDLSYSCGNIQFNFSLKAEAVFPTFMIKVKEIVKKDATAVIQSLASSPEFSNKITDHLSANKIATEKELFSGDACEELERILRTEFREHFIKSFGMLLNSVTIARKRVVEEKKTDTFDPLYYIL